MSRSLQDMLPGDAARRERQLSSRQFGGFADGVPAEKVQALVGVLVIGAIPLTMLIGWLVDFCPPPWVVFGTPNKKTLNAHWDYPLVGFVLTMSLIAAALLIGREFRLVRASRRDKLAAEPRSFRGPIVAAVVWVVVFVAAQSAPLGRHDVEIVPPSAAPVSVAPGGAAAP